MCVREGEKRRDIDPPFSPLSLFFFLLLSCMSVGSFVFEKIVHHGMSCSLRCNDSALGRLDFSKFSNSSGGKCFHKKLFGESLALTFFVSSQCRPPASDEGKRRREKWKKGDERLSPLLHR